MTIWMMQSKKKFVAGIFMGIIGVLIVTSAIWNMIDKNSNSTEKEHQTLDEFKSKYMTETGEVIRDQNYFVDTTGYTPEWAKDIGENQASMKCSDIMIKGTGDDSENRWCMEYLGYLLDKQN